MKLRFKLLTFICLGSLTSFAQSYKHICSTPEKYWQVAHVNAKSSPKGERIAVENLEIAAPNFKAWGATFNELDWDALQLLPENERNELIAKIFNPEGELRLNMGRISLGANDYARSWYSCDEVAGDLELRYFNIERDRQTIIPFVKAAQAQNPDMSFWISPWSPPSWMKINHDYPVLSSGYNQLSDSLNYLLYSGVGGVVDADEMQLLGSREGVFPRQLATQDYFIQDSRYLRAYANYFCKFIDAYAAEGIPVSMVIYQNEAYSYTPYPGCPWTVEGTQRFNRDYLAPALAATHPEVKLYMGTFNSNRVDHVQAVLSDSALMSKVSGVGFQWEGRVSLPIIRRQYPNIEYMCSESECGWGSFDHGAAEHTFELINHYLGNGCIRYNFWNVVLADQGVSPWGWKQNALIRVDSATGTATLTPEYYAVRHYSNFLAPGSKVEKWKAEGSDKLPVLIAKNEAGKNLVFVGNFSDSKRRVAIPVGKKYINLTLAPHSLHTFVEE